MSPKKSASTVLCSFIKGYLPVRLQLLSQLQEHDRVDHDDDDDDDEEEEEEELDENDKLVTEQSDDPIDETFFYIKEHNGSETKDNGGGGGATLFVANCPTIPNIATKLLLQSIFGRYGDVIRVTVIPKPTSTSSSSSNGSNRMASFIEVPYEHEPYRWTDQYAMVPSYNKQNEDGDTIEIADCEGKFAHVVFSSPKEMKRTFRTIHEIMSTSTTYTTTSTTNANTTKNDTAAITFDPIELQTLMDESHRQWQEQYQQSSPFDDENDDDLDDHGDMAESSLSAVQRVAQQYRHNCQVYMNRHTLLEECNRIMEHYEDEETKALRRRNEMTSQPDADGFITVSYSTTSAVSNSITNDFEQPTSSHTKKRQRTSDGTSPGSSKSQRTRNNKKKKGLQLGSLPIPDFYRFQTRQQQQNSISELRQRFEQDKIRIFQKMNHK